MKRAIASVLVISSMLFVYNGWFNVDLPRTAEWLNNDLHKHALAYEVIDGTPLILAPFGGSVFLGTIHLERISMNIPPYPRWQWTGSWERVSDPQAMATVELSSAFGPRVLFGPLNDESISSLQIVREGEIIQEIPVEGPAYIISAEHVLLTDTVHFLDVQSILLVTRNLMHK